MLIDSVSKELRRSIISTWFIDEGGHKWLGFWLEKLPDGSYPNIQITSEIMKTLSLLEISADNLGRVRQLERVVKEYAGGCSKNKDLTAIAKQIIDKWARMK